MKRIFLLFAFIGVIFCAAAQDNRHGNPEHAKYYIDGYLLNDIEGGQFVYKLTRVTSKGIHFTPEPSGYHDGEPQPNEEIGYTFKYCTTDYPGGIDATLKFWRQDTITGIWQYDGEVTQGSERYKNTRKMLIMLVLDCTNSVGSDFGTLKNSAKRFIETIYSKCPDGNVDIGIVGFNTISNIEQMTFDILPLTTENKSRMLDFIDIKMQMANNTALYYAMDVGCDNLERFANSLSESAKQKYDASSMVIFTDGLDNHSKSAPKGLRNSDMYLDHIANRVNQMRLMDQPLIRHVIIVPGDDLSDTAKCYSALRRLASNDDGILNFYLVKEYSELQARFESIANQLISRWRDLVCYVPGGIETRVRWTLGELKPEKVKKVREKKVRDFLPVPLFGINVGAGGGYSKPTQFLEFSAGLDLAFACSPKFAFGIYGSYKGTFQTINQMACGFDFMMGPQQKAFLLGVGCNIRWRRYAEFTEIVDNVKYSVGRHANFAVGPDVRLGGVFGGFYFFFDISADVYKWKDIAKSSSSNIIFDIRSCVLPQATFNIGINFTQLGKKNKSNKK